MVYVGSALNYTNYEECDEINSILLGEETLAYFVGAIQWGNDLLKLFDREQEEEARTYILWEKKKTIQTAIACSMLYVCVCVLNFIAHEDGRNHI